MSTYTQQYTRPYADGYKDRPDESTPEYARYINARDDALLRIEAFLASLNIPSKLSELINDEGFIKNTVSNLANYYLKTETYARTETYTQSEVQALIADAVSKVSASVDLSGYYKKTEVDTLLAEKVSTSDLVPSTFSGTKAVIGNQVSSGGGGSAMHVYSTEEQIIGTWIDGKPIYQKTLFIADSISNTEIQSLSNIENVDAVIELNGFCNWNDGNSYAFPIPYLSRALDQAIQIFYRYSTKSIHIGTNITITNVYATMKYTKTTDTATT